jgi:diadenosine tetraphosphatase ApaH/serine/threonine PP2A family protein phosphatase
LKFAVISDVHANLEALEAVLLEVDAEDVYCLGDLVDYGAQPNEVIQAVRERRIPCVLGNHDWAALTGDGSMFNARAAMSSVWSRKVLSDGSVEFLRSLPQEMRPELRVPAYFAHGSPDDRLWEYVDPRTHSDLFGHYLDRAKVRLMGFGHTHIPYVWKEDGRTVFNPGSVGQPRDGDWRASFAEVTLDGRDITVEIRRVEYDREGAAAKIRQAGLPVFFAERLATGT